MRYVGSKNRISKELKPIIESYLKDDTVAYIEPFVGGANMIDKIDFHTKIGSDVHEELIELLKYVRDNSDEMPDVIGEDEYLAVRDNKECYPKWYVGLVGFTATFGSKYFGGYARGYKSDKITPRNPSNEAIRNLKIQSKNLKGITFNCKNFTQYDPDKYTNCVFYLDPPYKSTLGYRDSLDYDELYQWCIDMSKNNTVLISEYSMPSEFECIWEKNVTMGRTSYKSGNRNRVEKLFTVK